MRQGHGVEATYPVLDCGPFVSGLGHADALSFELCAYGQTLLAAPGVYGTYWLILAQLFSGEPGVISRARNTVVVDNLGQSSLVVTWKARCPASHVAP